jgi:hypothetical protein
MYWENIYFFLAIMYSKILENIETLLKNIEKILKNIEKNWKNNEKYWKILQNIENILKKYWRVSILINIKCIEGRYIVEHIFSIFYHPIFQKGNFFEFIKKLSKMTFTLLLIKPFI